MKKNENIDLKLVRITFQKMQNDKTALGISLVDEALFMKKTLKKLKIKINKQGVVTEMCQGKYNIDRANPALSQYNMMIKNYQSCIKSFADLLPKEENSNDDDFDNDEL